MNLSETEGKKWPGDITVINSLKLKVQNLAGIIKKSKIPGHTYFFKKVIKNQVDNRPCSQSIPVLITFWILNWIEVLFLFFLPIKLKSEKVVLNNCQKCVE